MYSFDGRVRYSECDGSGRLSLVSLINYFQDCSTFQSEELGMGLASLTERGLAWVLALWQIEIDELPAFGERVRVSTWCYEMTRAHALRNFELVDASGRSLARANSQWLVFDAGRGRATRVPDDQRVYLSPEPPLPMPALTRRLRSEGGAVRCRPTVVAEHSLDTNSHVNNAQYVLLAQEALCGMGARPRSRKVTVQYRRQAHLDDVIVPFAHVTEGRWDVELTDESGAAYALVRFEDTPSESEGTQCPMD